LYTIVPLGWELAPLRDYLIGDASAMLMSHLSKAYKGENDSNPPTVPGLAPISNETFHQAYDAFTDPIGELEIRPQHRERIDAALARGQAKVAARLEKVYANYAVSRAAGELLRKLEGPLPHPIEFTRVEFNRGCLLAFCDGKYYLLVRLFSAKHRYSIPQALNPGFIDCKTKSRLGGKVYSGLILPLELGREFHEREYITHGSIQSAKLVAKGREDTRPGSGPQDATGYDFFAHIAFQFEPPKIEPETFLGIDRGAAKLGAATLIGRDGSLIHSGIDLDGIAFAAEMQRFNEQTIRMQKAGKQRWRKFSLRGKRSDIILGEYANRIVAIAQEHKSQIVIEAIKGTTMGRFLKQSQFGKLKQMLTYKAERVGLPASIEVPAAFTSQTCAQCGHKDPANRPKRDDQGKPIQDVFRCTDCGHLENADSNASHIIALRGLHQAENGGRFKKFSLFQTWLKATIMANSGQDGSLAPGWENL
jgi:IS605 OrfB family transposase